MPLPYPWPRLVFSSVQSLSPVCLFATPWTIARHCNHSKNMQVKSCTHRAGALGRPRGMGWGGKREGGLGWGTHVNPWLIRVNVCQKPQYCKVISLQLIKINEKTTTITTKTVWYLKWTNKWKIINNLRYADDCTLMAESEEEL